MILIVEDNPENAELLRLFLERKANFSVIVETDGNEVVRRCQNGEVRLVIMDIQLNNTFLDNKAMTGIDLTRALKSDPKTSKIPILLSSAHAMREHRESFLKESGANGYLVKPIEDYDLLIAEIMRWMSPL